MDRLTYLAATTGLLAVLFPVALLAESRGRPFSEEQLLQQSSVVFVGEVLETTTFDQHHIVPNRARVLLSIKGQAPRGEFNMLPKHPGKFVYFDEEFSRATKGRLGVFYIGAKNQPKLLMGYKELPIKPH